MKTIIKRLIALLLLISVGIAIYKGFSYVVVDDHSSRLRTQYPDFYNMDTVDSLFVGSSHMVYAANTTQLTDNLGSSYFNLASSGQNLSLSYYIIKDAYQAHGELNHVYCEISLSRLMVANQHQTATYAVTDYMHSFLSKAEMLINSYDSTKYVNAFSPLRRSINPTALITTEELQITLETKQDSDYIEMVPGGKYMGRGQWSNVGYLNEGETYAVNLYTSGFDDFTLDDVQEREIDSLIKIIDFCEKKDIELTFLIAPYNECYFMYFECYEQITDYVKGIVSERGCNIIDYNLVKDEYLNLIACDYKNIDHVKYSGSEKIADFLEQYLTNPGGDYFCTTIEEKYPHDGEIVAIGYERRYADSTGKVYSKKSTVGSKLAYLVVDLSAISYEPVPVTARLWEIEKDSNGEWVETCEISGENTDNFTTRFFIEYDLDKPYRMQLTDAASGAVLYETVSNFDMFDN